MFVCEDCVSKAGVSEFEQLFGLRSYGPCEWCRKVAMCIDSRPPRQKNVEGRSENGIADEREFPCP